MSEKTLSYYQSGTCCQFRCIGPDGRVNTLDLDHLHFHLAVFFHIYFCSRIQNTFSCTVTFTVMLFYVFNFRILSNEKSVDAVMLRVLIATVVDTTACYDHYIRVFANVEIIVNHFL